MLGRTRASTNARTVSLDGALFGGEVAGEIEEVGHGALSRYHTPGDSGQRHGRRSLSEAASRIEGVRAR